MLPDDDSSSDDVEAQPDVLDPPPTPKPLQVEAWKVEGTDDLPDDVYATEKPGEPPKNGKEPDYDRPVGVDDDGSTTEPQA